MGEKDAAAPIAATAAAKAGGLVPNTGPGVAVDPEGLIGESEFSWVGGNTLELGPAVGLQPPRRGSDEARGTGQLLSPKPEPITSAYGEPVG